MAKILRIVGVAGVVTQKGTNERVGQYVQAFDVEAFEGRGFLTTTPKRSRAKKFETAREALAFYQQTPKAHPVRLSDGKPNRPLTAFSVELLDA